MKRPLVSRILLSLLSFTNLLFAHPGSGIVVDQQRNVYFVDTGSGVWKIDPQGSLTKLQVPAYHWMAFDANGNLAGLTLPRFARDAATVSRDSRHPKILVSSDFPITAGNDGSLYYVWKEGRDQAQLFRFSPAGKTTTVRTMASTMDGTPLGWVNGIVMSPDGCLYYSEDKAVRRWTPQGDLSTVVSRATLSICDSIGGVTTAEGALYRGLDVDSVGNVFVAATGCRSVLKITPDGKVTAVLKTTSPWSPTGVAVSANDIYVLEYIHTASDERREWIPRVRKVCANGRIVTLAQIDRR